MSKQSISYLIELLLQTLPFLQPLDTCFPELELLNLPAWCLGIVLDEEDIFGYWARLASCDSSGPANTRIAQCDTYQDDDSTSP